MEVIFSLKEIGNAASTLLSSIGECKVLAFHGEMGVGKTTFIHACCETMGVNNHISSPTFSIINQYSIPQGLPVYHIDLYRLKDEGEAIETGVEECLYSGQYCLVEWPEKAPGLFPAGTMHVHISIISNDTRKLSFDVTN